MGLCDLNPRHVPLQALELVRGFAAAVQKSSPDAQREVVERVFTGIAIRDDQVVDVDIYPVYAEAFRWYYDPERTRGRKYHRSFSNTLDTPAD